MQTNTVSIFNGHLTRTLVAIVATLGLAPASVLADWEPTKPVEFVIPAGTGGGADQMARFIQGMVTKHNLMKQRWWW